MSIREQMEARDRMPLGVGSCFDLDGNLLALYRDAAIVAGWTPPSDDKDAT